MTESAEGLIPSTTESVKQSSQSREGAAPVETTPPQASTSQPGEPFLIGDAIGRVMQGRPYERRGDNPLYRPLRIFALDPSVSRLEGATALVNVPYEPLKPGPKGHLFCVDGRKVDEVSTGNPLDLEEKSILIRNGVDPSTSDPRFQDQMVYAVCSMVYTAFRTALGRHITWGFDKKDRLQLLVRPRAFEGNNSHYDKKNGELCFGFYKSKTEGEFPGTVYACLSHDTVAHEVTHALLDGLRAHFSLPTSPDVLAFHEAFADLVAVFQHFSYEQVVRSAIRKSRGAISRAALLTDIARQLGQTGREYKSALRSAIDSGDQAAENFDGAPAAGSPKLYDPNLESHELGSVLVMAVFEAFITVFRRKTERLVRLATNGSGRLPVGELPSDLQAALAEKASKLASQFLTMCIRAIDYCPPVDISFGEYLRAVITADKDLVPDDPWAYREAWIDAFRRHHIYPSRVPDLSEDSLLWLTPEKFRQPLCFLPIRGLRFARLKFRGDPAWPAHENELRRQAQVLGEIVTNPSLTTFFGVAAVADPVFGGDVAMPPKVQSIRSSRRIGPSGQVVFDLVAEVTQKRSARFKESGETCTFYGGSTVIIDPDGVIRYVIVKPVTDTDRLSRQKRFLDSAIGSMYKPSLCSNRELNLFSMLHEGDIEKNKNPALPLIF